MQLSPSTHSFDPNLLALLFPVATPLATPVSPAGAENVPAGGDEFEQLFATLAPAAPNPANVALPNGESGIARPPGGTRGNGVAQPGVPTPQNGIIVMPEFAAGDAASADSDDVSTKSARAQGRFAANLTEGDSSHDIGADASPKIDSPDSRPVPVEAGLMQNTIAPSALPVEAHGSEAKNATVTQTVPEDPRKAVGKHRSEAVAPDAHVPVFSRNRSTAVAGSNNPSVPSITPFEADPDLDADAGMTRDSSISMPRAEHAIQDDVTTSFPPHNAPAPLSRTTRETARETTPNLTRDATPPAPDGTSPARVSEAMDESATPAPAERGVQVTSAHPAQPADRASVASVAPRDGILPALERGTATAGREANFADDDASDPQRDDPEDLPADKSFVTTNLEELTTPPRRVGIAVANSVAVMSHPATTAQLLHPVFEYRVDGATAAGGLQELPPEMTQHPLEVNTAQRAVEAVLHAADRVSSREQSSVNLQFSVGDADLEVRVELHGGEVRTTFRTDSAELRAALSQEWQAVAGAGHERAFRLAPAVFAPADRAAQDAFSGDTASRQHDRNPQRGSNEDDAAFARQARAGDATPPAPLVASSSLHSARLPLPSAGAPHRLNLFA